jgi:hypothetical protein
VGVAALLQAVNVNPLANNAAPMNALISIAFPSLRM